MRFASAAASASASNSAELSRSHTADSTPSVPVAAMHTSASARWWTLPRGQHGTVRATLTARNTSQSAGRRRAHFAPACGIGRPAPTRHHPQSSAHRRPSWPRRGESDAGVACSRAAMEMIAATQAPARRAHQLQSYRRLRHAFVHLHAQKPSSCDSTSIMVSMYSSIRTYLVGNFSVRATLLLAWLGCCLCGDPRSAVRAASSQRRGVRCHVDHLVDHRASRPRRSTEQGWGVLSAVAGSARLDSAAYVSLCSSVSSGRRRLVRPSSPLRAPRPPVSSTPASLPLSSRLLCTWCRRCGRTCCHRRGRYAQWSPLSEPVTVLWVVAAATACRHLRPWLIPAVALGVRPRPRP